MYLELFVFVLLKKEREMEIILFEGIWIVLMLRKKFLFKGMFLWLVRMWLMWFSMICGVICLIFCRGIIILVIKEFECMIIWIKLLLFRFFVVFCNVVLNIWESFFCIFRIFLFFLDKVWI